MYPTIRPLKIASWVSPSCVYDKLLAQIYRVWIKNFHYRGGKFMKNIIPFVLYNNLPDGTKQIKTF